MSTELNHVIHSMSQVSIPNSILKKVDIKNLLKGFSDDYKKLDDLKEARERHEGRSFIGRWWNSDELEDAQLDAAELQASFSKKLGQLMVISVAQSQQIHLQQKDLSEQQNEIKRQTNKLAKNDEIISTQQEELKVQNIELKRLVKEYIELKGLTEEGMSQLVIIGREVTETKDSILAEFDSRMQHVDKLALDLRNEQTKLSNSLTQQLNTFKNEAEHRLDAHQQQLEQRIKQALQQICQTDEQLQHALTMTEQRVAETLSQALEQQKQQQAGYDQRWQADKTQVLNSLEQHQQGWMQEVQEQNSRLEALQTDNHQLRQQLGEQAQQHVQQVETLHQLFDSLKVESVQRELNWQHRWKVMTRTVAGALTVLTAALGYLAYASYYQLPLF